MTPEVEKTTTGAGSEISPAALAKRKKRLDRGIRDEAAAKGWSEALWRRTWKPNSYQLVRPLLAVLDRAGGTARPREVYDDVADLVGLAPELREAEDLFANGRTGNLWERQVRFAREEAKRQGLVESPQRGLWALTEKAGDELKRIRPEKVVVLFTTAGGTAWWAQAEAAARAIDPGSVDLLFTSPPYPLIEDKRKYGTMPVADWLEWMTGLAAVWRGVLAPKGSVMINLGPVGISGRPGQSPYIERFTLALVDQLGYQLVDRLYWHNPTRMPPMEWVAKRRLRVRPSVEPVLWFSLADQPKADNRRVLEPYKERDRWLGNEKDRRRPSGFDVSEKSFARDNGGRIPGSLIVAANAASRDNYRKACRSNGLPMHPAVMPSAVADFAIRLTTEPGDLIYDPFLGSGTTGAVAEALDRRWIGSEHSLTFLEGARHRFEEGVAAA